MNIAVASGVRWEFKLSRIKATHRGILEKRILRPVANSLPFTNRDFNLHRSFGAIDAELTVLICALSVAPASRFLLKSSLDYLEQENVQESQISIF